MKLQYVHHHLPPPLVFTVVLRDKKYKLIVEFQPNEWKIKFKSREEQEITKILQRNCGDSTVAEHIISFNTNLAIRNNVSSLFRFRQWIRIRSSTFSLWYMYCIVEAPPKLPYADAPSKLLYLYTRICYNHHVCSLSVVENIYTQ